MWSYIVSKNLVLGKVHMLKRLTPILLLLVPGMAATAYAESVGLAKSSAPFTVNRESTLLQGSPDRPLIINEGDRISSGLNYLKIENLNGQTLLIDENSSVKVSDEGIYSLEKGRMAVTVPSDSASRLDVHDLTITSLEGGATAENGSLAIGTTSDQEVQIFSQGRMFRVATLPEGDQVAVLGASDALKLVRDAAGTWRPIMPKMQPTENESTDAGEKEDEQRRRRGGFWIFPNTAVGVGAIAVGAAAAGYGGYRLWEDQIDDIVNDNDGNDDDNDRNDERPGGSERPPDRPPASAPIQPTPTFIPEPTPSMTPYPSPSPSMTPIETEFI